VQSTCKGRKGRKEELRKVNGKTRKETENMHCFVTV
jgi:hypothetical protein